MVFRHREHMQRLHDSAKIYRFPVSQSVDELMEACREVIRKNSLTSAYIRPLVFVGDVGMGVNPPPGYNTDVIIAAFPWGAYGRRSAGSGDRCDGFFTESRGAKHYSDRGQSRR